MLGTELCQTDARPNKYAARLEKKDSRVVGGSKRGVEEGRRQRAAGSGFKEWRTDPLKPVGNGFEGVLFCRQKTSAYFEEVLLLLSVKVLLLLLFIISAIINA